MTTQLSLFDPNLESVQFTTPAGAIIELTFDGTFKTFWVSQKQMADMFDIPQSAVSRHIQVLTEEWATYTQGIYVENGIPVVRKFRITQTEGNRQVEREVEYYNHDVAIDVGYRARSNEKTFWFRRTVNEIVRQRMADEYERANKKALKARSQKVTGYILGGMDTAHAERRVDTIDLFKELSAIIARVSEPKVIGQAVNKEYVALFGKLSAQLKQILNAKNVRDALPDLQLQYVQLAETSLILVLKNKDHMTPDELLHNVALTVTPLGQHLKQICEAAGIDLVTGRPLLK